MMLVSGLAAVLMGWVRRGGMGPPLARVLSTAGLEGLLWRPMLGVAERSLCGFCKPANQDLRVYG